MQIYSKNIFFYLFFLWTICFPLHSLSGIDTEALGVSQSALFSKVISNYNAGAYPAVVRAAEEFERRFPGSILLPEVQVYAGESRYRLGFSEAARTALLAALETLSGDDPRQIELRGVACYWLGRIAYDDGVFLEAAQSFSKSAGLLRGLDNMQGNESLYHDALLFGARACLKSGNAAEAVPVLEFLWSVDISGSVFRDVCMLLFHAYKEASLPEKLTDTYEVLPANAVSAEDYAVLSLYAANAYAETGRLDVAYELYDLLVMEAREDIAVSALSAAWNIAPLVARSGRESLLRSATSRLKEYPLLLSEFQTRLGMEQFLTGDYEGAFTSFSASQQFLSNAGRPLRDEVQTLGKVNGQYLAEIRFRREGVASAASVYEESSDLLGEFQEDSAVQAQLARYAAFSGNWEAACVHGERGLPLAESAYWYALSSFRLGKTQQSLRTLEELVFHGGKTELPAILVPAAAVLYADVLLKAGNTEKSLAVFEELAAASLLNDTGYLDYSVSALRAGESSLAYKMAAKSGDTEAVYIAALAAFNRQDWQTVETMLGAYLSSPAHTYEEFATFLLGLVQYRQDDFLRSYDTLYSFIERNSLNRFARVAEKTAIVCAMQLYQRGLDGGSIWMDRAVSLAEQLVADAPSTTEQEEAVLLLAGIYRDAGRNAEGIELLTPHLGRTDLFGGKCRSQVAEFFVQQAAYDKADAVLEETERLFSGRPEAERASYRRGEIYYSAALYNEAASMFAGYRKKYSGGIYADAALYFNGDSLERAGRLDEAILCHSTLCSAWSESSFVFSALTSLVRLYRVKGEYGSALDVAQYSLDKYPEQAVAAGMDAIAQELSLLAAGLEEQAVAARTAYERAGKNSTAAGRSAGVALATLYLSSPETTEQGVALLEQLVVGLRLELPAEAQTAAAAMFSLADWKRDKEDFFVAGELFLEAAVASSSFDEEQAAAAMYRAAEAFEAGGFSGDAELTIRQLRQRYPDSAWTSAAMKL